ncbi:MAG: DMT family transporter [Ichthyobacteriaceae bacterium]|nr:DMT family transporter [Ichthyobacteriaceae bacterium]
MLISSLSFALMNLVIKFLHRFPTPELILFRAIISFTLSYIVIKRKGLNPLGNNRKLLLLRGFLGITALTLFFFTLHKLPISTAVTIQYLSPIFTAIIAIYFLKEPMQPMRWVFFLISFLGIGIVKGFNSDISWIYLIAGVLSAFSAGFAYNVIRKLRTTDDTNVIILYFPMMAVPVMAVWSYFVWVTPVGIEWLLLLIVGLLTQVGQVFLTKALTTSNANEVTIMRYFGIIYALSFDYFIFNQTFTPIVLVGIALVIIGVVLNLSYYKIKKLLTSSELR